MGWEQTKDYMNSLLGAAFLLISILAIPEIRKKLKYLIPVIIGVILLAWLGIDKIRRDNRTQDKYAQKVTSDSIALAKLQAAQDELLNNYRNDTTRFGDFKKKLETRFGIKDSANSPINIQNYRPIYNSNIKKADVVNIGS